MARKTLVLCCAMIIMFALGACGSNGGKSNSTDGSSNGTDNVIDGDWEDENNDADESSPKPVEICKVTFKQAGQLDIVKTVNKGEELTAIPSVKEKKGYTVVWDISDFSSVAEDITVNAVETPNTYTITYDAGEGIVSINTQDVIYDSTPTFVVPEREGYTFTGWTYEGQAVLGKWTIADNVTLVATWVLNEPSKCVVTFRQNGQTDKIFEIAIGDTFTEIPVPESKIGYTVVWNTEDLEMLTNVSTNIVVEAIETVKTYTVTLESKLGVLTSKTLMVAYGESYELPKLSEEEYHFQGWSCGNKKVALQGTWNIDVEGNEITLTAQWESVWLENF